MCASVLNVSSLFKLQNSVVSESVCDYEACVSVRCMHYRLAVAGLFLYSTPFCVVIIVGGQVPKSVQ